MKKLKLFLFVFIIINSFLLLSNPIDVQAIDDLDFTFDDNVLFDSDISSSNDSFNLKQSSEYTEIYNATYSFENEIDGTNNTDIEFIDSIDPTDNVIIKIINNYDSHSKVLNCSDRNPSDNFLFINNFENQEFGTIEFWIQTDDASNQGAFNFRSNGITVFTYSLANDNHVLSGVGNILSAFDDIWYHISINFESTTGGYKGLSQYNMNIGINGVLFGDFNYISNQSSINNIRVFSDFVGITDLFLDAIGYSWHLGYNFEGDRIGLEPDLWNIQSFGTGTGTVERFQESQVLKVFDDDINEGVDVFTDFIQSIDQSIEYYIAINNTSLIEWYSMSFNENGSGKISLRIDNDDLDYNDGAVWSSVKDDFIIVNTWFKITIELNDSTNTFDIYINDILEGNNLDYVSNTTISVNDLSFGSDGTQTSITYLDNFIFNSLTPYYIGLNLFPFLNISQSLQEVDKYEYALRSINTLQPIGASTYGTWYEVEPGAQKIQIKEHPTDSNNRVVEMDTNNPGDIRGLVKDNFSSTDNFINITMEFEIILMGGSTSYSFIKIYSSDTNLITAFIMWHNGSLGWFPDIGSAGVPLRDDLTTGIVYTLQVFINYELDLFFLDWFIDGVYDASYNRSLILSGRNGLKEIAITVHWVDNHVLMELYSVGVYLNGISESKEIGWNVVDLQISDWNPHTYNLFNILASGIMSLGIISGTYSVGEDFSGFGQTISLNNIVSVINFYDTSFFNLSNPSIVFSITNGDFSLSHLKIDGVKLIEGTNEYSLIFEHTNVNIDESYFYVEGNILKFFHISNDSNLESIQARFNINDTSSEGYLVSFKSNIDDNAKGFFRVNYTTTSNIIQFPIIETITRFILTQDRIIRDLVILITDNNINAISGLTEGFIYNIELLQVENLLISVITTSLITMLIPIIMILIPSLAISGIFGKELLIPMFIFISIVLTFSGIIPIWLFFVIAISHTPFIIKKKEMV